MIRIKNFEKFCKISVICQFVILVLFNFLGQRLFFESDILRNFIVERSNNQPLNFYFAIASYSVLHFQSVLLALIITKIIYKNIEEEELQKKDFWHYTFIIQFLFSIGFVIFIIILYSVEGGKNLIDTYNTFHLALDISWKITVLGILIGGLLSVANSFFKINKTFNIILYTFCILLFSIPFVYLSLGFIQSEDQEFNFASTPSISSTIQSVSSDTLSQEINNLDNIDEYDFLNRDVESIETHNFLSDIWDNVAEDKTNVLSVFDTFLNQYMQIKNNKGIYDIHYGLSSYLYSNNKIKEKIEGKLLNRSPYKIRAAFDSYKNLFYFLITKDIYEKSYFKNIVKALLYACEEKNDLQNSKEKFEEIYQLMNTTKVENGVASDYYEVLKPHISEEFKAFLESSEKFSEDVVEFKVTAVWVYSFWGRRTNENNFDEVYKILREIDLHYEKKNKSISS
jgi:hypothetical protein